MRTLRRRASLAIAATAAIGLVLTGCSDSGSGSGRKSGGRSSGGSTSGGSSSEGSSSGDTGKGPAKDDDADGDTTPAGGSGGTGSGRSGPCTNAETSLTVTAAPRPVNYQLIKLTNTSKRTCTVLSYPVVSFGPDLDGTAAAFEDSKPQAVVTLRPGASAYAGLNTSPADQADDGSKPHAGTLSVDLTKRVGADGSTQQFGQPETVEVDDLFVHEPKVTYWQQEPDLALR